MTAFIDLTGHKYGRLSVTRFLGSKKWECICDCGNSAIVHGGKMRIGQTKSCGCLRREISGYSNRTHGQSHRTPEYRAWKSMTQRCRNKNLPSWKDYGARGIKVCDQWIKSFETFFADMGKRPGPSYSLDRIDVREHYTPKNCRWATPKEQVRNRRTTIFVTWKGERKPLSEVCEETGTNYKRAWVRTKLLGWSSERTFAE